MEHTADVARLTVRLATAPGSVDAFSRTPSMVCADIVTRAHAAGLTAATVYPGSYPRVPEQGARQISLSEPPELSVTIVGATGALRAFMPQMQEAVGAAGVVRLDVADEPAVARAAVASS